MYCRICGREAGVVRHLPIYAFGSEGVDVCHECEMQLVDYIRQMTLFAGRVRKHAYLQAKTAKTTTI